MRSIGVGCVHIYWDVVHSCNCRGRGGLRGGAGGDGAGAGGRRGCCMKLCVIWFVWTCRHGSAIMQDIFLYNTMDMPRLLQEECSAASTHIEIE